MKKLQKEVKLLVKHSRSWPVYKQLAQTLADMLVALPLVQDLQDEAIRERHWKKLMRVCGKSFVMDDKMSLQHLPRREDQALEGAAVVYAHLTCTAS